MLPSKTERNTNSELDAQSMNRHASSLREERAFMTSDHVHRFGRTSPPGPAGGGA